MVAHIVRWRLGIAVWMAMAAAVGLAVPAAAADRPPADQLLPKSTVAFISIANAPDLADRFMNTALGRMSQDPQLKPLIDDLYGSLVDQVAKVQDQIGLTLPELLKIPQGEIAFAVVAPEPKEETESEESETAAAEDSEVEELPPWSIVVLFDVGDQLSNARKLVDRGKEALEKGGATKREEKIGDVEVTIFEDVGPGNRLILAEKDSTLIASTEPILVEMILNVWNGGEGETLVDNQKYAAIMRRCGRDRQVSAYVDPIGLIRAVGGGNMQVQFILAALPTLGLDGLLGVGGSIALDTEQYDSVMHAHVLMDSPRNGILEMLALGSGDVTPERWVPEDASAYITVHWRVETMYKALVTMFDSFRGEGAFSDLLAEGILEPTGIDLETDLVPNLEGRMTLVQRIQRPVTMSSQASLLALKLKDSKPFEKALEMLAEKYDDSFFEEKYANGKYYKLLPEGLRNALERAGDDPLRPKPPEPCFAVVANYFMVANRPGLLEKVLLQTKDTTARSLRDSLDFKLVASKIGRQPGGAEPAGISFERPDEGMRWIYELIVSDRAKTWVEEQSEESEFLQSVDDALKKNPPPPFEILARYFAPSGAMLVDDQTGFHYMAFSLKRKLD